jgi:hypothetical protein
MQIIILNHIHNPFEKLQQQKILIRQIIPSSFLIFSAIPEVIIAVQLQFWPAEVNIINMIDRDKMDMGMRYFKSDYGNADTFAWNCFLNCFGNPFGKNLHSRKKVIINIKNIINLFFGYYKCMTGSKGIYVQEGIIIIILGNFM